MTSRPQLRVLDLTDGLALQAGRLFVGTGADVIRVTPADVPDPTRAEQLHWHAGKRVVREAPDRIRPLISQLVGEADVVIESGPLSQLRTLALREDDPAAWKHVAHVVVTPFGLTGPRSTWLADDTVASAAGGMAWLGGNPREAPVPAPRQQATQLAGTHAAIAALLILLARRHTGSGQLAEISVQEAVAATLETGVISWIHAGTVPGRTSGVYGHVAHRIFETADGYVAGGYSGPNRMWTDLLAWMAEEGEAEDLTEEVWQDPGYRWQHREHVDRIVADFAYRRTTEELDRGGLERALPWAAVTTPVDLLQNPQFAQRRFIVNIDTPQGMVRDVGFPYPSPGQPQRLSVAQEVGPDVKWDVSQGVTDAQASETQGVATGIASKLSHGALTGLKVLDLSWVLAGPYVTKILAEHGAEIIKVESRHRQDPTRFSPSMRLRPDAGPDQSGYFLNFNRNKRSLALNLRTKDGIAVLRRLAREADVIVENFSPGVLAKWDLSWDQLREINPGVILVSMSGVGATGPWHRRVTFADTLAAMAGLTHETGIGGDQPHGLTFGLGDMIAANAATVAILDLLLAGCGEHVDLSQLEAMAAHLGTAAVDHQLPTETGRTEALGPFILPSPGEDRWLAIGATPSDVLEAALVAAAPSGLPRSDGPSDLSSALAHLTLRQDSEELASFLQSHGVAAYPVRDGHDLVENDPQLATRDFYPEQTHPAVGKVRVEGMVNHLAETGGKLHSPAPLLGQHTDELLAEHLGLTQTEIDDLHREGVLE